VRQGSCFFWASGDRYDGSWIDGMGKMVNRTAEGFILGPMVSIMTGSGMTGKGPAEEYLPISMAISTIENG
jgi:hypothetical protein